MTIRAVFTDLDGTLLEPDGSVRDDVLVALAELRAGGVPVCPMTSKTAAELVAIMAMLHLATPAAFENGAGVLLAGGSVELHPTAVPLRELASTFARARLETGAPARSILELSDGELSALTGLSGDSLFAARQRRGSLPLIVDVSWDDSLRAHLAAHRHLRLVRGNRFLHLQGNHDKTAVLDRLLELVGDRPGVTVACGDAPNDSQLLASADVAVIVPGRRGPHPELVQRFPQARRAPFPHGRGWAASVRQIMMEDLRDRRETMASNSLKPPAKSRAAKAPGR